MDAGDLGEAQPGLGLVLGASRLHPAGEEQPDATADTAALRDTREVRGRGGRRARGAEEDGIEPEAAQRGPQVQAAGPAAPEPGERNDDIDGRDAVGEVDGS